MDQAIQYRVLNDTRGLKRLFKKLQDSNTPTSTQEDIDSFLLEYSMYEYGMQKQKQILLMAERERKELLEEQSSRENDLLIATEKIKALKEDLKIAQENRRRRMEYDEITKLILKVPSRASSQAHISQYHEDILSSKSQLRRMDLELDTRKLQFADLLKLITTLKESFSQPVLDEKMALVSDGEMAVD